MAFLKSLPKNASIGDIYRLCKDYYRPWMAMGQKLMRGESELSNGEREMIATYVSGLNGCEYCVNSHLPTMKNFGIAPTLIEELLRDIDSADIDEKLRPVFHFCRKLTIAPTSITQRDVDRIFDAGWGEEALHTIVGVTCRFSFMNRLTLGLGLTPLDEDNAEKLSIDRINKGYDSMDKGGVVYRKE